MLFSKKATTFQEMFPDDMVRRSLEALTWTYGQSNNDKPFEWASLSSIEKESEMLFLFLSLTKSRKKYGDYLYSRRNNRIDRESPKIKLRRKSNPIMKLSAPFKIRLRKKVEEKGIVTKIT